MCNFSSLKETIEEKMPMGQQVELLKNMIGNNFTLRMYFEQMENKVFEEIINKAMQQKPHKKMPIINKTYLSMMDSMTNAGTLSISLYFFE